MAIASGRFAATDADLGIRRRFAIVPSLCEQFVHDARRLYPGQPLFKSLKLVGKSFVIDAQTVQDRRIEGVDVNWLVDDVVAEVVGLAVGNSTLDAAASQPHAEIARVMVAAVVSLGESPLRINRAAEFAPPHD